MTAHPHDVEADPVGAFEAALRIARAATHETKLERPVAEAFRAITEAGKAAADAFIALQARLNAVERDLAALKAKESLRVHSDA